MDVTSPLNVRQIREELELSQSGLAASVGVSTRAIQSYEQGWRTPSEMVERVLLLLLIVQRRGRDLARTMCWEHKGCPPSICNKCVAHRTRQGHLCWFFTGTLCEGKRLSSWSAKLANCLKCSFMQSLLRPRTKQEKRVELDN